MQPEANHHLYIKHAVGSRMLFDVSGSNKPFQFNETEGGWTFTIHDVEPQMVELLRKNIRELNIFYFVEQPGQPIRKSWLYDKDYPKIDYDDESLQCLIRVDTKKDYNNETV